MAIFAALLVFPTESKGFFFFPPTQLDKLAKYSQGCWGTEPAESAGGRIRGRIGVCKC